tara:strand:- start:241 stop:450 length:210 start_codon:yes stop_codon:yes gene_type:complete
MDLSLMIIEIALKELHIKSILGPVGVREINSKNKLILNKLGWRSTQTLKKVLQETYFWIDKQIKKKSWG